MAVGDAVAHLLLRCGVDPLNQSVLRRGAFLGVDVGYGGGRFFWNAVVRDGLGHADLKKGP